MNYGQGNKIKPFKGRKIDFKKPVWVYRNLNCKGVNYSIKQNGLVVAHATRLMLNNVEFKVSEAGRKRALMENRRNVHAFAVGKIARNGGMGTTAQICEERNEQLPAMIKYNPKKHTGFTCENLTIKPYLVKGAMYVVFNKYGVSAAYTY